MNEERLFKILLAPRISEKSTLVTGQYVFAVLSNATKLDIKQAVENRFDVTVKSVHTCNVKGKTTRFRQVRGRRKNWKKAYVMLAPGSEIDITSGE